LAALKHAGKKVTTMKKSIELTAVDLDLERGFLAAQQRTAPSLYAVPNGDEDDEAGDLADIGDELEQQPSAVVVAPAATTAPVAPEGLYFPVTIYEDDVREFYQRKGGRSGTRIVYKNGAARPVKESYAEVKAAFASLNN
jgi:hypothetical protein